MKRTLPAVVAVLLATGCGSSGESDSVGATCQSTCEKSVALACPNEQYGDVATCVTQCEEQIAGCASPSIVQDYLDCVQTTPMECGSTLGTASSPQCVQQGLAYWACLEGMIPDTDAAASDAGGSDAGTDAGGDEPAMPAIPSAAVGELAVTVNRGGETYELRCDSTSAAELGLGAYVFEPGGAGAQPVPVVEATCRTTSNRNDPNAREVKFVLTIDSLDVGSYAIASESPAMVNEEFLFSWRDEGGGFMFQGNRVVTENYEGTVTIVESGGIGGTTRVRLEARWDQGRPYVDNVPSEPDSTPGAIAAEWAFTRD